MDMTAFDTALDTAVATTTHIVGVLGGKGVVITLAVISAAVVIVFIRMGVRKGFKALKGKV